MAGYAQTETTPCTPMKSDFQIVMGRIITKPNGNSLDRKPFWKPERKAKTAKRILHEEPEPELIPTLSDTLFEADVSSSSSSCEGDENEESSPRPIAGGGSLCQRILLPDVTLSKPSRFKLQPRKAPRRGLEALSIHSAASAAAAPPKRTRTVDTFVSLDVVKPEARNASDDGHHQGSESELDDISSSSRSIRSNKRLKYSQNATDAVFLAPVYQQEEKLPPMDPEESMRTVQLSRPQAMRPGVKRAALLDPTTQTTQQQQKLSHLMSKSSAFLPTL